ncbi:MAG: hypothetical protein KME06_17565 [Kastovskya adunca ATA6-11-RM4]|jgi:hypothetical protein|nr:hypothetical protein [Kastovskya adunca ATA6-11-RM4]
MTTDQMRRAVGIFSHRQDAEQALQELRDAGFNMDRVSVIARNPDSPQQMSGADVGKSPGEQAQGGAGAGAVAGGVTGGVIGLVGSIGVLAIPGIGPAAAIGTVLADTLIGGGIGAVGGGLVGALVGWGIPEDRAKYYDERVSQGEYLIVVEGAAADIRLAEAMLHKRGIRDWGIYDAPGTHTATRM